MTAAHAFDYPLPADWQVFERLCFALMTCEFKQRFYQFGREGQKQHGIDGHCILNDGRLIAVECKKRHGGLGHPLSVKEIDDIVSKSDKFPQLINELHILTTGQNDGKLDERAIALTLERHAQGKGSVVVWGWQSIQNRIREHESLQKTFYPNFHPSVTSRHWVFRAAVAFGLMAMGFVGVQMYQSSQQETTLRRADTTQGLSQYLALHEQLIGVYDRCLDELDTKLFSFSYAFQQYCTAPVGKQLEKMRRQVQISSLMIDVKAVDQLEKLLTLLENDYSQGIITYQMTESYEKQVMSGQRLLCPPGEAKQARELLDKSHDALITALNRQLYYYFTIRDFILPSLNSMQARVIIAVRENNGQAATQQMIESARELGRRLEERNYYQPINFESPFTVSATKVFNSRSIKMKGFPGDVESLRYGQVLRESIFVSYVGHPNEVQHLIDCGAFLPDAKKHFAESELKIREAAQKGAD